MVIKVFKRRRVKQQQETDLNYQHGSKEAILKKQEDRESEKEIMDYVKGNDDGGKQV
jgi:hypothetical protein